MIEHCTLSADAREFHGLPSTTRAQRCTRGEIRLGAPEDHADTWKDHSPHCPDASAPAPQQARGPLART
ncbi:hypothetical protein AR457_02970 [Streptomyces agglomeratus]|uniref:Uncharacterized protein n=1 Tax=Streptomyces agglomeratus TaxID=285458 RepID=A0A1E5P2N1_9ACTN|nr:hypothetical protein [Streptomyces agglomeratus]OEJ23614.1 hypothetical protein AS594_03075 [Streptomyces agglomeratus]OEJ43208.1 hypothetical protein AR457_02970 [Streptomyces agglomeratus]OEJ54871.1 hypothetical protein BGK72_32800 [Streptomyces agglomeratus]